MAVNNEVGAIQPLKEIAAVLEDFLKYISMLMQFKV